ncbi:LigA [Xanthobacter versatilis]|uniref:LigA n=1 Tax=Xanthobacter autotrophicus (strain ATCC BAA-1158 / Py2) TaxID=78245 RepID=A7IBU8_XANP2|nr:LigA [Xanthobacter autotrophicus Py2]
MGHARIHLGPADEIRRAEAQRGQGPDRRGAQRRPADGHDGRRWSVIHEPAGQQRLDQRQPAVAAAAAALGGRVRTARRHHDRGSHRRCAGQDRGQPAGPGPTVRRAGRGRLQLCRRHAEGGQRRDRRATAAHQPALVARGAVLAVRRQELPHAPAHRRSRAHGTRPVRHRPALLARERLRVPRRGGAAPRGNRRRREAYRARPRHGGPGRSRARSVAHRRSQACGRAGGARSVARPDWPPRAHRRQERGELPAADRRPRPLRAGPGRMVQLAVPRATGVEGRDGRLAREAPRRQEGLSDGEVRAANVLRPRHRVRPRPHRPLEMPDLARRPRRRRDLRRRPGRRDADAMVGQRLRAGRPRLRVGTRQADRHRRGRTPERRQDHSACGLVSATRPGAGQPGGPPVRRILHTLGVGGRCRRDALDAGPATALPAAHHEPRRQGARTPPPDLPQRARRGAGRLPLHRRAR